MGWERAADVLHVVNVVAGGVVVGAFVTESLLILPLVRQLSPERGQEVLRTLSPIAWRTLPFFGGTMTLSAFAILAGAVVRNDLGATANAITLVATLVTGLAFLSNVGPYLRADRRLRALPSERVGAEFAQGLRRLGRLHVLRLTLFGCAYVLFVVAAVLA